MKNTFDFLLTKKLTMLLLPAFLAISCSDGNSGGNNLSSSRRNPFGDGPAGVSLSTTGAMIPTAGQMGSAGNYVIMGKAGIDDTSGSTVVGNMAASPIASTGITDFSLSLDLSGVFSTSASVNGSIYASDYSAPTPSNLTTAISNMETAYVDAAGRTLPDFIEHGAGEIGGLTLVPGLYKWGTGVLISNTVYISGSATDVWIFQISQDLIMSNGVSVILGGSAKAENIFWQVAGQVTIGTTAHFEGIILSKTAVSLQTNSTMNGRIYAQTLVTLDSSDIVEP